MEEYLCGICRQKFEPPDHVPLFGLCGHTICSFCRKMVKKEGRCPFCCMENAFYLPLYNRQISGSCFNFVKTNGCDNIDEDFQNLSWLPFQNDFLSKNDEEYSKLLKTTKISKEYLMKLLEERKTLLGQEENLGKLQEMHENSMFLASQILSTPTSVPIREEDLISADTEHAEITKESENNRQRISQLQRTMHDLKSMEEYADSKIYEIMTSSSCHSCNERAGDLRVCISCAYSDESLKFMNGQLVIMCEKKILRHIVCCSCLLLHHITNDQKHLACDLEKFEEEHFSQCLKRSYENSLGFDVLDDSELNETSIRAMNSSLPMKRTSRRKNQSHKRHAV